MLPSDLGPVIESCVGSPIVEAAAIGGGCIANATHVRCADGDFFVKWNRGEAATTFTAEAAGLSLLRAAHSPLLVPEPLLARDASDGQPGILILTWIESGVPHAAFWDDFGHGLAGMHRYQSNRFGLDTDNFIGRSPQRNTWENTWPAFFRKHRLQPQLDRARRSRRWKTTWNVSMDRLLSRLPDFLPDRPEPSVLHGDLWSGNYMVHQSGKAVLIDPAVYYGHREADLAMAELFGGFDRRFFEAYREAWPIESGYPERREIYNLYHAINHLNHFGSGYAGLVDQVLRKY